MANIVIYSQSGENPKLKGRVLADGRISLFLETYTYVGGAAKRNKEALHYTLLASPRTIADRQGNKETLALAKNVRYEREQELKAGRFGYRLKNKHTDLLAWFDSYASDYAKADVRMIKAAVANFRRFLSDDYEYKAFANGMKPEQLTKDMVADFAEYLSAHGKGEGPKSIFARFKKIVRYAAEHDVLAKNVCEGVTITIDSQQLRKAVLSASEMQAMLATHYEGENSEIRRAFALCLYCGIRYCDVKALTYANVDYSNARLHFEQAKTSGHSSASAVDIPLTSSLLALIGKGAASSLIFRLPTNEGCNKALTKWVQAAGINKHITWHCARHSVATNLLINGANIKTVASILGHAGLKNTEKYVRAVDSLKAAAIESLPVLKEW